MFHHSMRARLAGLDQGGGGIPFQFIGTAVATVVGDGDPVIDLSTITGLQQDDVVVVIAATGRYTTAPAVPGMVSSGWTTIGSDNVADAGATSLTAFFKVMGSSVDTSVTIDAFAPIDHGSMARAFAFRGLNLSNVVASHSITGEASNHRADPASATPSSSQVVLYGGAAYHNNKTFSDPGDWTNFAYSRFQPANFLSICYGYEEGGGVLVDPSRVTANNNEFDYNFSNVAFMLVLNKS